MASEKIMIIEIRETKRIQDPYLLGQLLPPVNDS